jgi:hypothetical protein
VNLKRHLALFENSHFFTASGDGACTSTGPVDLRSPALETWQWP